MDLHDFRNAMKPLLDMVYSFSRVFLVFSCRSCHPRRNSIIRQKKGRAYGKICHGDQGWRGRVVASVVLGRRNDRSPGGSFHGNQSFLQNQRIWWRGGKCRKITRILAAEAQRSQLTAVKVLFVLIWLILCTVRNINTEWECCVIFVIKDDELQLDLLIILKHHFSVE